MINPEDYYKNTYRIKSVREYNKLEKLYDRIDKVYWDSKNLGLIELSEQAKVLVFQIMDEMMLFNYTQTKIIGKSMESDLLEKDPLIRLKWPKSRWKEGTF